MSYYADFAKPIQYNMLFLNSCKNGKKELDNSRFIGTMLMDLSKPHDCFPQDILITKLAAYGLEQI